MEDMGMTDKQFNAFLRFLVDDLAEIEELSKEEETKAKLKKIVDKLQKTIED